MPSIMVQWRLGDRYYRWHKFCVPEYYGCLSVLPFMVPSLLYLITFKPCYEAFITLHRYYAVRSVICFHFSACFIVLSYASGQRTGHCF